MNNDGFIYLLEEHVLLWIVASLSKHIVEASRLRHYLVGNFLLLILKGLILSEMCNKLLFVLLGNCILVSLALLNFHEIVNRVQVIDHRNTISHDLLLLFFDVVELLKALLDCKNTWVLSQSRSISS